MNFKSNDIDYDAIEKQFRINNGAQFEDEKEPNEDFMVNDRGVATFELMDDTISDIDFSQFKGDDFKGSFSKINKQVDRNKKHKEYKKSISKNHTSDKRSHTHNPQKRPLTKEFDVKRRAEINGKSDKKIAKVIVPNNKKVIVEGVSKFILSQGETDDSIRNIGYYKGKKLKELVLIFNNDSAIDFNVELFNPSMPLDYLQSTSQNLNDKIQVAGGAVSYSDVLYNLLANPMLIVNARFIFSGPNVIGQKSIPLSVQNKRVDGVVKVAPLNLDLQIDNMQVFGDIVNFDIMKTLNRVFVPDGMDIMKYKVLANHTVTMAFFYKQVSLKRVLLAEARNDKKLL